MGLSTTERLPLPPSSSLSFSLPLTRTASFSLLLPPSPSHTTFPIDEFVPLYLKVKAEVDANRLLQQNRSPSALSELLLHLCIGSDEEQRRHTLLSHLHPHAHCCQRPDPSPTKQRCPLILTIQGPPLIFSSATAAEICRLGLDSVMRT